jgi:hypothetical protein
MKEIKRIVQEVEQMKIEKKKLKAKMRGKNTQPLVLKLNQ